MATVHDRALNSGCDGGDHGRTGAADVSQLGVGVTRTAGSQTTEGQHHRRRAAPFSIRACSIGELLARMLLIGPADADAAPRFIERRAFKRKAAAPPRARPRFFAGRN